MAQYVVWGQSLDGIEFLAVTTKMWGSNAGGTQSTESHVQILLDPSRQYLHVGPEAVGRIVAKLKAECGLSHWHVKQSVPDGQC